MKLQMKPHIWLVWRGIWACKSRHCAGIGQSPKEAYSDWSENWLHIKGGGLK